MVWEAAHNHRVELKPFQLVPFLSYRGGGGEELLAARSERSLSRCPRSTAREGTSRAEGAPRGALVWGSISHTDSACDEFVARSTM